jgi:hypothetical protein
MIMCKYALCFLIFLASSASQAAPQNTDWGKVTLYATGWSADLIRVQTTAAFINQGCTYTDGYVTDSSDPGNHTHQSALLAAFTAGKDVVITIDGCTSAAQRPKIIGVTVR